MVGGPSIIFHHYHEKGLTAIRQPDGKRVSCLEGYDASALYLWALIQDMPTEDPVRRRKENHFKAEKIDRFGHMAREWLEWTMHSNNTHLQHKFNGKEQVLGQRHIRVDGWDSQTKTVYQFHGCLFHGHDCCKTQGKTISPVNGKTLTELRENSQEITDYLRETSRSRSLKSESVNGNETNKLTHRFDHSCLKSSSGTTPTPSEVSPRSPARTLKRL